MSVLFLTIFMQKTALPCGLGRTTGALKPYRLLKMVILS